MGLEIVCLANVCRDHFPNTTYNIFCCRQMKAETFKQRTGMDVASASFQKFALRDAEQHTFNIKLHQDGVHFVLTR